MKTHYIGTRSILRPNLFGQVTIETPKTITVRIVDIDFSSKTSKTGVTHRFSHGERKWLKNLLGQQMTFNKATGKEIRGDACLMSPDFSPKSTEAAA